MKKGRLRQKLISDFFTSNDEEDVADTISEEDAYYNYIEGARMEDTELEGEEAEIAYLIYRLQMQKQVTPVKLFREDIIDYIEEESEDFPEYTNGELNEQVTFIRPFDVNDDEASFEKETKSVFWCVDHGWVEIEPGVWTGDWYFEKYPDAKPYVRPQRRPKGPIEERLNRNVHDYVFQQVLKLKVDGNSLYQKRKFQEACTRFTMCLSLFGGEDYTMFLKNQQREEAVKILSNKAECHLRLKQYHSASLSASLALLLDENHVKSLMRRAKSNFKISLSQCDSFGPNPFLLAYCTEDLSEVIRLGGEAVQEAYQLRQKMVAKVEEVVEKKRNQMRH